MANVDAKARRASSRRPFAGPRWSLVILVAVYLPMALTYTLLTREYEPDDEAAHVQNIEYVVQHDSLPRIAVTNGRESHQPPLYYLLEAGWQDVLGISAFKTVIVPAHKGFILNGLLYSTHYTPSEHADAVHVHELRLLSVVFGLGTVVLTYAAGKAIGLRERMALAAGLFVALYPKNLIAASSVTNDALVFPLCSLALVLFLLGERARTQGRLRHRRMEVVAMGVVLGAAAITKLTSLPVAIVLFVLALLPSLPRAGRHSKSWRLQLRLFLDVVLAVVGFFAVSAWWFYRNHHLYGQFLATDASQKYLAAFLLHPVPWNSHLLFKVFPNCLLDFSWFNQAGSGSTCRSLSDRRSVGHDSKPPVGIPNSHSPLGPLATGLHHRRNHRGLDRYQGHGTGQCEG